MSLWKAAPCPNSFLPLVRVFQGDMAYNHDVDLETSAYLVILEEYENCTWEMLWTDEKQHTKSNVPMIIQSDGTKGPHYWPLDCLLCTWR